MVYSAEHLRWINENSGPTTVSIAEGQPEWFIKKFLDRTITAKQASSLLVSLRSNELRCATW
jgi:cytokinesis protein